MPDRGAMDVTAIGPGQWLATGTITECATDDYLTLDLPNGRVGATIVAVDCNLATAGSASTVRPVIANSAGTSLPQLQAASAAARSYVEAGTSVRASNAGRLFVFPVPNQAGGAGNVTTVEVRFKAGWP
jgi:hypothetical protein